MARATVFFTMWLARDYYICGKQRGWHEQKELFAGYRTLQA